MKTRIFVLTAALGLSMTACQEDGLNGKVSPDLKQSSGLTVSTRGSDANATILFDFNENVYLNTEVVKSEETRNTLRVIKPQTWRISGYGDSEIENRGSWFVELDLQYNIATDAISGVIKFTFPDYGDEVTLVAYGGPVLQQVNGGDDLLKMDLAATRGTGRYEKVKFEGGASIILTSAWIDNGEMLSKLDLHGIFIEDNGE